LPTPLPKPKRKAVHSNSGVWQFLGAAAEDGRG